MNPKQLILGTLAYTLVTFPIAVIWHVVLFEETYKKFGYFEGEPNFLLGLITIVMQGAVLSLLFPFVKFQGNSIARGLKYALLLGVFFWTSHVLAFIAKQVVADVMTFVFMESFYLLIQFSVFGILIGYIHREKSGEDIQA